MTPPTDTEVRCWFETRGWTAERISCYDEEGVEGWRWTHPDDAREFEALGEWDEDEAVSDDMRALVVAERAAALSVDSIRRAWEAGQKFEADMRALQTAAAMSDGEVAKLREKVLRLAQQIPDPPLVVLERESRAIMRQRRALACPICSAPTVKVEVELPPSGPRLDLSGAWARCDRGHRWKVEP